MLLAAAETIVIEQGPTALTARRLAMRVGYTVGSVYMVYANMAAVAGHLNQQTFAAIVRHLQCAPQKNNTTDNLHGIGLAYLGYIRANYQRWLLWAQTPEDANCHTGETYQALLRLLEAHLPGTGHSFPKQCLAKALWAAMQGVCAGLQQDPSQLDDTQGIEECLAVLAVVFSSPAAPKPALPAHPS